MKLSTTDRFIAYIAGLLEDRQIGSKELIRLIKGLEKKEILNPIPRGIADCRSKLMIHHEGIQEFIDPKDIDQKKLYEWLHKKLEEIKDEIDRATKACRDTQDTHLKMVFHRICPGSF